MTEPDLMKLGNDVSLDNHCSAVAPVTSRGHFSLNHLKIGKLSDAEWIEVPFGGFDGGPVHTLLTSGTLLC
ncbi:hypothetical protein E1B28_005375 [Marasmius oreades]|uniref:Uncharacterized protein n=1 Tax=Marasmius oreades TaxID=181124 RepID=A0A9P7UU69_9AGAR|nr:uncharacterized protein E1B28_005375 [Marasmius oreades]KAG7094547.1 hypothetical protein E1B28_005375 [Marasmius oreades]